MTFQFPDMVRDPRVQIDLRDPKRAQDREDDYLLALMDRCFAEVEAEQAAWADEKRLRQLLHGDPPKPAVPNLHVDSDLEGYLAEERALHQAEFGIDEDDDGIDEHRALAIAHDDDLEEDDPECEGEPQ